VSEANQFWYHCGRCGALFQSEAGLRDERVCTVCGADPCLPRETTPDAGGGQSVAPIRTGHANKKRSKHGSRKRGHRHVMLKLVLGWTLLLSLIVFGARQCWHSGPDERTQATGLDPIVLTDEDVQMMQTAGTECGRVFEAFLRASTPESRNQFVLSPVATASRMARFYSLNPITNINPEGLRATAGEILHFPDGRAYESRWESGEGDIYETVFRKENNEWRLDWDHFARYSDYPWALFIAGSGPDEGEFRLLARERLAAERKDEPAISLVLYAPRFGNPHETGFQSPEFLVSRDQRAGQLLDAAFKLAREGGRVFGGKSEEINPDGMIRVRLKVRRFEEEEAGRRFEITDVIACHWYSVDDPGVEPLIPAPAAGDEAEQ